MYINFLLIVKNCLGSHENTEPNIYLSFICFKGQVNLLKGNPFAQWFEFSIVGYYL